MNYDVINSKEDTLLAVNFLMEENKKKAIFNGEETVTPIAKTLYVNKEITIGDGSIPLLTSNLNNDIGNTNFDGNKLDDSRAFVMSKVGFFIGIADKGTSPHSVEYVKMDSKTATAFQFAEITLRQGDILMNQNIMSITKLQKDFVDYMDLDLSLLRPSKKIDLDINFPIGVVAPTLETGKAVFISVQFVGHETYNKR